MIGCGDTSHTIAFARYGSTVYLSPGEHNALQVAIIEEFDPRFAPGAVVLNVGDTAKKHVIFDSNQLARLGGPSLSMTSCRMSFSTIRKSNGSS